MAALPSDGPGQTSADWPRRVKTEPIRPGAEVFNPRAQRRLSHIATASGPPHKSELGTIAAVLRMARAAGAEIRERPVWPGAASTMRHAGPAAGMRYARMLADAARQAEHAHIRYAREEGLTWQQVGQALRLEHAAEERGAPLAEVAFEHATGAEHTDRWDRLSFYWRCASCGQSISDHGPDNGHPVDCEHGHAEDCQRLAAAVAAYEAEWADED
jgi:rubrerythrin